MPESAVAYNQRAKIFNLVASRPKNECPDGQNRMNRPRSMLCITYDPDTDDVEIIVSKLQVAGRLCLYQGDDLPENRKGDIQDNYEIYMEAKESGELAKEVEAIKARIERGNP